MKKSKIAELEGRSKANASFVKENLPLPSKAIEKLDRLADAENATNAKIHAARAELGFQLLRIGLKLGLSDYACTNQILEERFHAYELTDGSLVIQDGRNQVPPIKYLMKYSWVVEEIFANVQAKLRDRIKHNEREAKRAQKLKIAVEKLAETAKAI